MRIIQNGYGREYIRYEIGDIVLVTSDRNPALAPYPRLVRAESARMYEDGNPYLVLCAPGETAGGTMTLPSMIVGLA